MDHKDNYKEIMKSLISVASFIRVDHIKSAMFELGFVVSNVNSILCNLNEEDKDYCGEGAFDLYDSQDDSEFKDLIEKMKKDREIK